MENEERKGGGGNRRSAHTLKKGEKEKKKVGWRHLPAKQHFLKAQTSFPSSSLPERKKTRLRNEYDGVAEIR